MAENCKYVFDFDSTLTQVEALDVLAEISLKGNPKQAEIIEKIKHITDMGIDGTISFTEGLKQRLAILEAREEHLPLLVSRLKKRFLGRLPATNHFLKPTPKIFM